jgi:hypothetical protein
MTMIANAPPIIVTDPPSKPPITGVLDAGSFWPHIDLAKLRDSVDVDGSVTAARLTHAAANALASVIKDLSNGQLGKRCRVRCAFLCPGHRHQRHQRQRAVL